MWLSVVLSLISAAAAGSLPRPPAVGLGRTAAAAAAGWDIIAGQTASRGEFPWQAQLKRDGVTVCGGVLVAELWVLTAAHCLASQPDVTAYQIILGEYDVSIDEGSEQMRDLVEIVLYSDQFGLNSDRSHLDHENDVALLKMNQPAIYTQWVKALDLPDATYDFTGVAAVAAGWGASGSTVVGPIYPKVLQKITMTVMADDECQQQLVPFKFVPRTMSCAAPPAGSSLCWGDSGGGLVYYESPTRPLLAAVTSWGVDCDLTRMPTVFADAAVYAKWIAGVVDATDQGAGAAEETLYRDGRQKIQTKTSLDG